MTPSLSITRGNYYKYDENSYELVASDMVWKGSITINEDGTVEAECKMYMSGSTHTLTFSGEIEIHENFMPTEPPYSTLTEDKECDFSNHSLTYSDQSDDYDTDLQAWDVSVSGNYGTGDHVAFVLLGGAEGESDIFGRYTVGDSIIEYAPVVDGWVEIKENSDKTVTITFDVYDDLNNNITGSWTSTTTNKAKASAQIPSLSVIRS